MATFLPPEAYSQMPIPLRMEALSVAYVNAIAGAAGINTYTPRVDVGTDMYLSKVKQREDGRYSDISGPSIGIQIKATTCWEIRGNLIVYDLKVKNFNDLINSDIAVLVLMCLPPNPEEWLHQDENRLELYKCSYYWRPSGLVATVNTRTKRILIPREQMFTVDTLILLINEGVQR